MFLEFYAFSIHLTLNYTFDRNLFIQFITIINLGYNDFILNFFDDAIFVLIAYHLDHLIEFYCKFYGKILKCNIICLKLFLGVNKAKWLFYLR